VKHGRHKQTPIPVEEIAEFDLGLNIIPVNRLKADFDIDGFISSNFTNLYVDLDTYEKIQTRYRFTLAHEIGHCVLHKEIFENFEFDSMEEWKRFVSEMDEDKRGWLEYQGYSFAGCLLVPKVALESAFDNLIEEFSTKIRKAKEYVPERATYAEYVIEIIAARIAPEFDVSLETVKKRIKLLNLQERIP
jgi:Zn-dependent peptidase ImmA (M78 family)